MREMVSLESAEAACEGMNRNGDRERNEEQGTDYLSWQAGTKASRREGQRAGGRETAFWECWHAAVCESHSRTLSSTMREDFMS